jgi:hypothetical protein
MVVNAALSEAVNALFACFIEPLNFEPDFVGDEAIVASHRREIHQVFLSIDLRNVNRLPVLPDVHCQEHAQVDCQQTVAPRSKARV